MQDPYVDTQNSMPYQPVSMPDQDPYQATLPQHAPGQFQTDPHLPPVNPRRSGSRVRTGAIIALTLVLVLVFGVGLFAGWQFGRSGTSTAPAELPAGKQAYAKDQDKHQRERYNSTRTYPTARTPGIYRRQMGISLKLPRCMLGQSRLIRILVGH